MADGYYPSALLASNYRISSTKEVIIGLDANDRSKAKIWFVSCNRSVLEFEYEEFRAFRENSQIIEETIRKKQQFTLMLGPLVTIKIKKRKADENMIMSFHKLFPQNNHTRDLKFDEKETRTLLLFKNVIKSVARVKMFESTHVNEHLTNYVTQIKRRRINNPHLTQIPCDEFLETIHLNRSGVNYPLLFHEIPAIASHLYLKDDCTTTNEAESEYASSDEDS